MAETAEEHFQEGLEAYREGDIEKALRLFTFGLTVDKNHWGTHLYLGMIYARQNKVREAKQEFLNVRDCALDPEMRKKAASALAALSPTSSQTNITIKRAN